MKKVVIVLALMCLAILLYGISKTETFHETYKVKKNAPITIKNINGSVQITSWDKDYVDVVATKKTTKSENELEEVEIVVLEEDGLSIETKHLKKNPKVSVSYELSVPTNVVLKSIRSSNGSISIESVGEIEDVKTSNGSVTILKSSGDINIITSNGTITVDNISGDVIARTSNGRIKASNIDGIVDAHTSNGSINLINVAAISRAKTSNGSIKAQILQVVSDLSLTTSNGSINVYLNPDLDADIKANTSNGRIKLHDVSVYASDISKSNLYGQIGDGGNLLKIRTSNASIHIYDDDKIEF